MHLEQFYHIVIETLSQPTLHSSLSHVAETIRSQLRYSSVRIGVVEAGDLNYFGRERRESSGENDAFIDEQVPAGVVQTGQSVLITAGGNRRRADLAGNDAVWGIGVPIVGHGSVLGVLAVRRFETELSPQELDLLEKVGRFLGEILLRSRGRSSERHHLDQLVKLQNLMARIIGREDVTRDVEDILSEIAGAFDYTGVALGLLTGGEIRFFSTYQSAITGGKPEFSIPASHGVAGRAIRTGEPQFVLDVASDPDYQDVGNGARQELCVPISGAGEVAGVLDCQLDGSRQLVVDDLGLMLLLADSFGLVISNRRQLDQLKRRNLQLQLVERIVATIAGKEMIRDSFYELLHEITDTFGFDLCSVALIENGRLKFTSVTRHPEYAVPKEIQDGVPLGTGVTGQVALTGQPEFVRDVSRRPGYIDYGWGAGSEICIPIMVNGRVAGVLNVESVRERPLGDDDFEVLTIIANHLGMAMAKEELLTSERESRLAMEAVQQISSIIASTLDLDEALRLVVETLSDRFGYAYVGVRLVEGDDVKLRAARGYDLNRSVPEPLGTGLVGQTAQSGEPVFVEGNPDDLALDGMYADAMSRIVVPIRSSGHVVGVLDVLGTPDRDLSKDDLQLLQTFADHTGIVLNNAQMYAEVRRLAVVDSITGVPNHRYFQERLAQEFERAGEESRLSLLVIDLDNFKMVNDRYGHITGDGVLSQISRRLKNELRREDLLARYAGDEFVVLLPGVDRQKALEVGARLRRAVQSEPFQIPDGNETEISITVGVSTYPDSAQNRLDLLRTADDAMYIAKRQGRNSVFHADEAVEVE